MPDIDVPVQPERDPAEWTGATHEERAKIVDAWTAEWAAERSRGTVHPLGAPHRTPPPPISDMFTDWEVAIAKRMRATYGVEAFSPTPEGIEPPAWLRTAAAGREWFRTWRAGVQNAYAAAAAEHAAAAEAERLEHERLHPGYPYVPGSLNPLTGTKPEDRVSLEQWAENERAARAARQAALEQARIAEAERWAAVQKRAGYVAGALRPAPGKPVAEVLADEARRRQERKEARDAETERQRQNRIAKGHPPGRF